MDPATMANKTQTNNKKESYYRDLAHELQFVSDISDDVMQQLE